MLVCTLDGHILDANPAFYAVTGLPFEGVRGNRIEVRYDLLFGLVPIHHRVIYGGAEPPDGTALEDSALSEE